MNKYIILTRIAAFFVVFMSLSSCTKENRTNCSNGTEISFDYTIDTEINVLDTLSEQLFVHIFDENGIYLNTQTDNVEGIKQAGYKTKLEFQNQGKYSLVTVGDAENHYATSGGTKSSTKSNNTLVPGVTHIDDFRVSVIDVNSVVDKELENFILGERVDLIIDGSESQSVMIKLLRNSKTLNIKLEGVTTDKQCVPVVRCKNGMYNSNNTIPSDAKVITYHPHKTNLAAREFTSSTLRIIDGTPMPFSLEDSNGNAVNPRTKSASIDLLSLIKLNPKYKTQKDLDNEREFNVTITYEDNTIISVVVNKWKHIFVTPEITN